ncbi:MAG: DUF1963 domain-containing protein [Phycisphaerales bacterium]|nr:DUF1963 domain-containing protein [Phycisphaerales bacterium]
MPTIIELTQLLEDNDLSIFKDYFESVAAPCYSLEPKGEVMNDLPIATSKVGGLPHLPDNYPWPVKGARPLMFLAQINLEDIDSDHVQDNALPKSGLLTFWGDTAALPWGFDPNDSGTYQVHYFSESPDSFSIRELPDFDPNGLDQKPQYKWTPFNECELQIKNDYCYNNDVDEAIESIFSQVTEEQADDLYHRFMDFEEEQLNHANEGTHQLLGHPHEIQGDMKLECQLVSNGIDLGNQLPESEKAKIESLMPGAKDWRLLLQLDSDQDAADWMWGDCGKLYFWIKEQDLRATDFSSIWGIIQCY